MTSARRSLFHSGACLGLPVLLLAGCAVVPNLGARPEPLAPAAVAASQSLPGTADAQWPVEGWWQAYGDPQLDALMAEGLAHAPSVAAAEARLARAAALALQAGAPLLPRLDGAHSPRSAGYRQPVRDQECSRPPVNNRACG